MVACDFNFGLRAALCKHAETCELESEAFLIDPALLPTLEALLLETYAMLRPKPVDYEQRHTMIDVFNKIAKDIFGKRCSCLLPFGSRNYAIELAAFSIIMPNCC